MKEVALMKRIILLVTVALVMAAMLALASPAFADHAHNLITPGTTVENIGSGQTEKGCGEPGYHKFHENVHIGTPGTFAFPQSGNVSVVKTENATPCA
jgi:hypothetical protein